MASLRRTNYQRRYNRSNVYSVLGWLVVICLLFGGVVVGSSSLSNSWSSNLKAARDEPANIAARQVGVIISQTPWERRCTKYRIDNKLEQVLDAEDVACSQAGATSEIIAGERPLEATRFQSVKKAFGGTRSKE